MEIIVKLLYLSPKIKCEYFQIDINILVLAKFNNHSLYKDAKAYGDFIEVKSFSLIRNRKITLNFPSGIVIVHKNNCEIEKRRGL